VGTVKKSTETSCRIGLSRNVRQVGLGGFRWRNMYLATLVWLMSMPSLSNSPECAAHDKAGWHGSWSESNPVAFRFVRAGRSKSKTNGSLYGAKR
jgi:hypothetical protein